jgi:conjugative transposon TraK protein
MFQQFKNIDTAFRFARLFTLFFVGAVTAVCFYVVHRTTAVLEKDNQRVFVLFNGKLLEAMSIERSDSLAVEVRDHVKQFHLYFYSLQADGDVIKRHVNSALYLCDNSARQEYNNLLESGYYNSIISANVSQEVQDYDSIQVNVTKAPYYFRYFGKLKIIRATTILTRSLVTEGYVRIIKNGVSDNNPHGMLIEGWKVLDNKDLNLEKR